MDDGKTHLVVYPLLLLPQLYPIIFACSEACVLVSVCRKITVQGLQMIHLIPRQTREEASRGCWRVN